MPLKMRCRGCEAVLNVPDAARGKVIACTKCGKKLKVPAGDGPSASAAAASAQAAPGKARKKVKTAAKKDEGDFFDALKFDDYDLEDQETTICPYCAAELEEDDPVCRSCGMNVETGKMDRREKKIRERKGPNPSLFYGKAWSESWQFMWQYKGLALRTGYVFLIFSTMFACCSYMGIIYIQEQMPPKVFWLFLTAVATLGIPGWYFSLSQKVIASTLHKEELKADRIHFDFFVAVSTGLRAVFWPVIVSMPVLLILVPAMFAMGKTDPSSISVAVAAILVPMLFMLPLGLVHMSARYSYKGWILWELMIVFFKNIGAAIYWVIVATVVFSPVIGLSALTIVLLKPEPYFGFMNPFASPVLNGLTGKAAMAVGGSESSALYWLTLVPLNVLAVFIIFAPTALLAGFPALFCMKANALLGYYNQRSLDLVQQMGKNTPATFWVRFLSHSIDCLTWPFANFIVSATRNTKMLAWVLTVGNVLVAITIPHMLPIMAFVWALYTHGMYWIGQEASNIKTTLGKDAFGLIVITDKGKELSTKQAVLRWILRVFAPYTFLLAAFHPQKKALHDIVTNTKVCWKGDR